MIFRLRQAPPVSDSLGCRSCAVSVKGVLMSKRTRTDSQACLCTQYLASNFRSQSVRSRCSVINKNVSSLCSAVCVENLPQSFLQVHAVIGVNPSKRYDVSAFERQERLTFRNSDRAKQL